MRDSKQIFINQLLQLWNEYTEAGVDNTKENKIDYTLEGLINYLRSRYL